MNSSGTIAPREVAEVVDHSADEPRIAASPLSAAVLAGGQSRRMGTDKALLMARGATMLAKTVSVLRSVSEDVFVVGSRPGYDVVGAPVFPDDFPGSGTLGGIATALRHAKHERVFVVACDMPLLSRTLLSAMAAVDSDADIVVPVRRGAHQRQGAQHTYETLHAIYRRSCLAVIERQLADGDLRVFRIFDDVCVLTLDEAWLREQDPDLVSLSNANTPDEFQRAMELLREQQEAQEDVRG